VGAVNQECDGRVRRVQVKGRSLQFQDPVNVNSQKLGGIRCDKDDWDAVFLVLLDGHYNAYAIYEAERTPIEDALEVPGSVARNERGQLSVSKFKAIGRQIWAPTGTGNSCVL